MAPGRRGRVLVRRSRSRRARWPRCQVAVAFKRRIKADLERHGYVVVAAASSRGAVDLVALARGRATLAIQCQRSRRSDPAKLAALRLVTVRTGVLGLLVTDDHGELRYLNAWTDAEWHVNGWIDPEEERRADEIFADRTGVRGEEAARG